MIAAGAGSRSPWDGAAEAAALLAALTDRVHR